MADDLMILRQTMTSVLDNLEKRGFIQRIPHPVDRRRCLVHLLPAGLEEAKKVNNILMDYHKRLSTHFSPEELAMFISLRNRVADAKEQVLNEIENERQNNKT